MEPELQPGGRAEDLELGGQLVPDTLVGPAVAVVLASEGDVAQDAPDRLHRRRVAVGGTDVPAAVPGPPDGVVRLAVAVVVGRYRDVVYRWMITRDARSVANGVAADRDQAANDAPAALAELPR